MQQQRTTCEERLDEQSYPDYLVSGWIVSVHERNAVRHNIRNTGGDARRLDSNSDESETDKANCEISEEGTRTSSG